MSPALTKAYATALQAICEMVEAGAGPVHVAAYVRCLGLENVAVSHAIENQAEPGSFAAAVFDILCEG